MQNVPSLDLPARRVGLLLVSAFATGHLVGGCASTSDAKSDRHAAPATSPDEDNTITNGNRLFYGPTFLTHDPTHPEVKAIAVDKEGRILALYRDMPVTERLPRVKLPGAFAVPGLHDAHIHIEGVGQKQELLDLRGSTSVEDIARKVKAFADAHPELTVIKGRGWDQSLFADRAFPTARDLEGAADRPVILTRVDGHAVWVNGALLKAAAVDTTTNAPEGAAIEKDASGAPTGVFVDNAMALVRSVLPPPTPADHTRWLRQGLQACADAGLVAVHEMGMSLDALDALVALDAQETLPVRVFVYVDGSDPKAFDALAPLPGGPLAGTNSQAVLMGVKLFADGAMGSRGAALLEPYADAPETSGLMVTEPKLLEEAVRRAQQKGAQVAIHAIGDRGVRAALEAIGGAQGQDRRRHRIEHAQLVHPDDFAGFSALGVIASMQPTHATSDMRWIEARVGAERVKTAYAWKTFLDDGVPLAFGSDAPVESERPTLGLYAAVTRQDADANPPAGFLPAQRLGVHAALAAFSEGAAYAVHREDSLGKLAPGMLLDVTVFDRDARVNASDWLETAVTATVVGGRLRVVGAPSTP